MFKGILTNPASDQLSLQIKSISWHIPALIFTCVYNSIVCQVDRLVCVKDWNIQKNYFIMGRQSFEKKYCSLYAWTANSLSHHQVSSHSLTIQVANLFQVNGGYSAFQSVTINVPLFSQKFLHGKNTFRHQLYIRLPNPTSITSNYSVV